jgi:hypothetical protein
VELSPRASQRMSAIFTTLGAGQICAQMITLLLDQGPGKNEKQTTQSRRKSTFHFTSMVTWGSLTLMSRSGAWTAGPWTHQFIGGGTPPSAWRWGHLDLQWLPLQRGQGPSGGWGCLLGCPPFGHSLQKRPSFPQWWQVQDVGPHQVGDSLRAAIRS